MREGSGRSCSPRAIGKEKRTKFFIWLVAEPEFYDLFMFSFFAAMSPFLFYSLDSI